MDDLRSEIRAAFRKEQAANPPAPTLRHDIVRAVAVKPRREVNLQWLAVAVAALLGIAVVASLMWTRAAQRASVPAATPTASPGITDRDYGPPPSGVPLFFVASPSHPGWYIGFDWNGVPQGTIKLVRPLETNSGLAQAPDGSQFQVTLGGKGGAAGYLDRLGEPVIDPQPGISGARWADDSRHLCVVSLNQRTQMLTLETRLVGEAPREVAPIYRYSGDEIAVDVAACSFKTGRAIVVRRAAAGLTLWLIELSDGKMLQKTAYTSSPELGSVTASDDGSLIAENSSKSQGFIGGPAAPQTVIRRALDGSVVATLDPSFEVLGFSADGSEALVATTPWAPGTATHVALVELGTGKVLWRGNENAHLAGFFIEPVGAEFALLFGDPGDSTLHPPVYVVMVPVDGRAFGIPGRFVRA